MTVYLYFLGFHADDLKMFYDNNGIAAISYLGKYDFLNSEDVIRHCVEEGYIERKDDVAFILYGFTKEHLVAQMFESIRNMHIFKRKKVRMTKSEYDHLCRFREAALEMERVLCGIDEYLTVVMNGYERTVIDSFDDEAIVSEFWWESTVDDDDFILMENGYSTQDDLLSESLLEALECIKFKSILGLADYLADVQLNEWSVFYMQFCNTLQQN